MDSNDTKAVKLEVGRANTIHYTQFAIFPTISFQECIILFDLDTCLVTDCDDVTHTIVEWLQD